jgi:hypothetical protein
MPCEDVTETLHIQLDAEERLAQYALTKRSCGRQIGSHSRLLDLLKGQTSEEILAITAESWCDLHPADNEIEEFLDLKHLFALQSALDVYCGKQPGGLTDACTIVATSCEGGVFLIEADIKVHVLTNRITACGRCGECEPESQ